MQETFEIISTINMLEPRATVPATKDTKGLEIGRLDTAIQNNNQINLLLFQCSIDFLDTVNRCLPYSK